MRSVGKGRDARSGSVADRIRWLFDHSREAQTVHDAEDLLKELRDMEGWSGDDYSNWTTSRTYTAPTPAPLDPIESAGDDVLILELVKRGYAVAKMPPEKLAEIAG
jgi:hypothetical protein